MHSDRERIHTKRRNYLWHCKGEKEISSSLLVVCVTLLWCLDIWSHHACSIIKCARRLGIPREHVVKRAAARPLCLLQHESHVRLNSGEGQKLRKKNHTMSAGALSFVQTVLSFLRTQRDKGLQPGLVSGLVLQRKPLD